MSSFRKQAALFSLAAAFLATTTAQADEATSSNSTDSSATAVTEAATPASPATSSEASTSNNTPTASGEAAATASEATPAAPQNSASDAKATAPVEGQEVDVRILATTDLHTNLVNYDYYQDKPAQNVGLAKTAVLIEDAKKENSNVLLVDNGDTIQGTPLGTYKAIVNPIKDGEQHPMYAALQKLGFDAGTLGNHEFNYGLDYLKKVISTAGMPIVNANVVDPKTGAFVYDPYKIIKKTYTDKNGRPVDVNIGVTGIVPPQILSWDKANLEGKVKVNDSVEAIQAIIPEMRKAGADVVLVLSHSGIGDDKYEKGEENEGYQIASLPGVDAVVTGHSHAEFPSGNGTGFYEKYAGVDGVNGKINGTPVTMAGKYGDHLGVIDLNLRYTDGKWSVVGSKAAIRKIDTKSQVADERITAIAKESHEGTVKYVRQQVGTTSAPITSYFALVKDDPSIQIVNNAQIWYAKKELAGTPEANLPILSAAAPFKAGTRGDATAYTDIPAGPIAIKNVADLYLYDNVTAILKVTGAQLKEWLEMSAGQFNTIDPTSKEPQQLVNPNYRTYNFDVIDGVTYEFDVTQPNKYDREGKTANPDASRVRNLKYQGKEVTADQEFIVVTNNYRANGKFPGVRDASLNQLLGLENRQAIINYILEEKNINPSADGNWRFTSSIKDADVRFLTADKAKDLVGKDGDVVYLEPSKQEGFGEYRFVYVKPKVEPETKPEEPTSPEIGKNPFIFVPNHQKPAQDETITLSHSQQTITLPAPSQEGALPVEVRQETAKPVVTSSIIEKALPETGQRASIMALVGLVMTGLGFLLPSRKKEEN
ncbi:bifunctional 2',3'-cyclic nucleotide 2'-phosphodiesterase/3'-nucleotidase precursor protein [Streptococcus australis]|uniref:Putative 2',3'-cyclic-nucleotide 2'-phosphodiesterase n=1 Tax=Streptococcus australis ATCC 700641 TaxID=888833 RepID=E7S800_9STRE|nr:bifunctional 2',3'-cyclic-nucleotide 2'-phosphodiesterase/3'-nucleotidase [Streptococcus australis]EFW00304.1 putative 2',3'-cyclic-nucleotide 2'-phosphodiesterase [Streptococcus australis ATCC 700641]EGU68970.1 bifunctional 2',3'-cyclic nucleotide 2'-phosphodiesterase/3'-nucleotidase protein [Streptococcus australis ATCC 700641]SQH65665.1 bifunctional 2',3'-cyclic nucleotide 2'-phosphodiesterase/3'-nucleotidase precursor protein [Streptococcus australis]